MKKLIIFSITIIALTSCKTGWTMADQEQYVNDCLSMSPGVENAEDICNCGLQKAMDNFESKAEAEKAIQNMSDEEIQKLFAECM